MTDLTRRSALRLGAATIAVIGVGMHMRPLSAATADILAGLGLDGAEASDAISIDAPEIAENGNTVPIRFSVDAPMTEDSYVKRVVILAEGNPNPGVATFHFSPMSGEAAAGTRMRLAQTQNVVAVAEMSSGELMMAQAEIKVTIGGCGG